VSAALSAVITVGATLAAGATGAVIRGWVTARRPVGGTHGVNLVGTLLLALTLVARDRGLVTDAVALVVGIGFCGALTTFSGWMGLLDRTLRMTPVRAVLRDLVAPVVAGVALTVLVFAALGA
jgi:CrcB protein